MTNRRNRKDKKRENVLQKHDRKPYVKPQLIEYGDMEKVTGGIQGSGTDTQNRRRV